MSTTNRNPHLVTTSTATGRATLRIFEDFQVDRSLPKHAGELAVQSGTVALTSGGFLTLNNVTWGSIDSLPARSSLWQRLWAALCNRTVEIYLKRTAVPVEETFAAIIGRGRKLEVLEGRLEAHRAAVAEARAMGQQALVEQLEGRTHMAEMEAMLFAAGHREFIEEETLIDFAAKCEKGLRLDWVKNFTRLIPHGVRTRKTRMDALKVFDNYAVLSYDPEAKGSALTAAEIEKKKDPILFGLIKGSTRLYHVGSWKDEFCDLTFGELIDRYGKDALTLQ